MGQLVCAVIAESEVQARRAAKRVKIVYQDLEPVILTIEVTSSRRSQRADFSISENAFGYSNRKQSLTPSAFQNMGA